MSNKHWESALKETLTTFHMPHHDESGAKVALKLSEVYLPYRAIRLTEPWTMSGEVRKNLDDKNGVVLRNDDYVTPINGMAEYIFIDQGLGGVQIIGKITCNGSKVNDTTVTYLPEEIDVIKKNLGKFTEQTPHDVIKGDAVHMLRRFCDMLDSREVRYIEEKVSRPVRRAMGVSRDYREYIIIRKHDHHHYYDSALKRTDIIKRLKALHAVRGHMRHLQSGKTVFVKPHMRGKGEALQIKDYINHA